MMPLTTEEIKEKVVTKIGDMFGFNKRISIQIVGIIERNSNICKTTGASFESIFECQDADCIDSLIHKIDSDPVWKRQNKNMYQDKWKQGLMALKEVLKELAVPDIPELYTEGALQEIHASKYERNKKARLKCIEHYGAQCCICGFDFENVYGEIGKGFIEVHHIKPISENGHGYQINPVEDLRPVCSNCHSMIHRTTPPQSIETMKLLFKC